MPMPTIGGIIGGMPPISEEMIKVHVQWQIESLQNLLRQIEKREAEKQSAKFDAAAIAEQTSEVNGAFCSDSSVEEKGEKQGMADSQKIP